jgi:hypothetical protein
MLTLPKDAMLIRVSAASSWLLSVLVLFVFSRGLFELASSKIIGYGFGILGLGGIVAVAITTNYIRLKGARPVKGPELLFFLVYLFATGVSLVVTTATTALVGVAVLYTSLHIFFLFSLLLLRTNSGATQESLRWPLHLAGFLVATTGALEFLGVAQFPGDAEFGGYTRLAGSLGSKQHFSFASAALGMLLLWVYFRRRNVLTLALSLTLVLLSFASLSRNGYPIILGTLTLYFLTDVSAFLRRHLGVIALAATVSLIVIHYQPESFRDAIQDRLYNLASTNERANSSRIDGWRDGIRVFLDGPILFGNQAGSYSQASTRLGFKGSSHFESALVQQFANFGIVAGISFVLFFTTFSLSIKDRYLRGLATMISATYIYYPGSESIPIIGAWFLLVMANAAASSSQTTPVGHNRP